MGADKSNWPKSYLIPSILLSAVAAVLLVLHLLRPDIKVDAWTVTLFVVAFLPWLRTVFDSIGFPGGANIKFRELEARQERQAEEIQTLRFLTANFLREDQQQTLRRLADPEPFTIVNGETPGWNELMLTIGDLGRAGLIERYDGVRVDQVMPFRETGRGDLKDEYRLTKTGRDYLALLDKLPNT